MSEFSTASEFSTTNERHDMTDTDRPTPAGYFASDGEWLDHLECYEVAFAALRFGKPWNGFCTPVVGPDVMAAFVAYQQMVTATGDARDRFQWDGNGVRVESWQTEPGDDSAATWVLPDADGNFDLGLLGYTFTTLSDDDRVIRKVG